MITFEETVWMASPFPDEWDYYRADLYDTKEGAIKNGAEYVERLFQLGYYDDPDALPIKSFWIGQVKVVHETLPLVNGFRGFWSVDKIQEIKVEETNRGVVQSGRTQDS